MKKLVPLCHKCSAKLIDAGIDLDAKPETYITIKELERICDKEKAEYIPCGIPNGISPVWNTAILRILTAAKRAARKESKYEYQRRTA